VNQLNANLRTIFDDLVERRLWPIALALVIALIAIPVLLSDPASESPAPAPAPAVPSAGAGSALPAFEPVVNTEGSKSSEIRKNLTGFNSKDPFKVHGLSSGGSSNNEVLGASAGTAGAGDTGTTLTGDGSGTGSTGSGSTGSGTPGSGDTTTGDTTGDGAIRFYEWKATVRFGVGEELDTKKLSQFRALPSSEDPIVVFMGVTTDGKNAVFMPSAASGTAGDGDCEPEDTCTFIYMKPGQTQTFEAVDENDQVVTYTLRLTDVDLVLTDKPANTSSKPAKTRAERRARRAERIKRDRRDERFSKRIVGFGF
jgi:hypothetical protein